MGIVPARPIPRTNKHLVLQKVGLLPKSNLQQLTYAYTMYARDDDVGLKLSVAFKRAFSVDVKIDFLGCW